MKRVKLFEQFHSDMNSIVEGIMSNIDLIGKDSATKEDFLRDVKDFLKKNAADPKAADNDEYLEELSATYFDNDGKKIEQKD